MIKSQSLFTALLCLLFLNGLPNHVLAAERSNQVFILDASGSMWGQIEGQHKIGIAHEVMGNLIQKLPDDDKVGLVVYGHRRKGDCKDIETLAPLAPVAKNALISTIKSLKPKGKTPITESINQAIELVKASNEPANVILISDGLETCGGDPCEAVRNAVLAGANFVMHVVGFAISDKENTASLQCAAEAGGGQYFDANNAQELNSALEQSVVEPVAEPEISGGYLSIKAVADGKLADVSIVVTDVYSGEKAAEARTYTTAKTNPNRILLPAGRYKAKINPLHIEGEIQRELGDIIIAEGETVAHEFDFSMGTLSVRVLENGKLADASIRVDHSRSGTQAASGRTYTGGSSNPQTFNLVPGTYNVTIRPLQIEGGKKTVYENIELKAGETILKTMEYGTAYISVKVSENGALNDASVKVYATGTNQSVAQSRTYTSGNSNPKQFRLNPGKYDVVIESLSIKGETQYQFDTIELNQGETEDLVHDYETGSVKVSTVSGSEPVDATIKIIDSDGKAVVSARSYGKPREYSLLPGEYNVIANWLLTDNKLSKEMRIMIEAEKNLATVIDFKRPEL